MNLIGASFRIAPNQKKQVDGQTKLRYFYTTEHDSDTQKNDLLIQ